MMNRTLLTAAVLTLAAVGFTQPAVAGAQHSEDDHSSTERRIIVDVNRDGPRVWGLGRGGYLGVHLIDLTPELRRHFGVDEAAGVLVGTVADDSPAARAGLEVGDIVTSIDTHPASGRGAVARRIAAHGEGDSVSLEVFRDGSFVIVHAEVDQHDRPQLWLNSLGDNGHYRMEWQSDDDGVWVIPSPDSQKLEIRREKIDAMMGTLHERLASPDFSARMFEFRSNTEELESRIQELEKRLSELSEQLLKLEE